jgi:hypothetical protein
MTIINRYNVDITQELLRLFKKYPNTKTELQYKASQNQEGYNEETR